MLSRKKWADMDEKINQMKSCMKEPDVYYIVIPPRENPPVLESCDIPKGTKHRLKNDRCVNKQIAKRRKKNKNRKTHRK